MKKIILCIIFLALSGFLFGQDVRNVYWGMSREEVLEAETTARHIDSYDFEDGDSYEKFAISFAGAEWGLKYSFKRDLLKYIYYETSDEYDEAFKEVKAILIEKYGEPLVTEYPDKWVFGELKYGRHWWWTKRSTIILGVGYIFEEHSNRIWVLIRCKKDLWKELYEDKEPF